MGKIVISHDGAAALGRQEMSAFLSLSSKRLRMTCGAASPAGSLFDRQRNPPAAQAEKRGKRAPPPVPKDGMKIQIEFFSSSCTA
jgi:hypothetical protein